MTDPLSLALEGVSLSLLQRVHDLRVQLLGLSEARAGVMVSAHSGRPDSTAPPGSLENPNSRHPDPDVWLYDWFIDKIGRVAEHGLEVRERIILSVVTEGEIRLSKRTHRPPSDLTAGHLNAGSNTEERDHRIATEYVGLSPFEVAIIELFRAGACSEENIRRVRVQGCSQCQGICGGRDPETGHPLPSDARLQGAERRSRARELHAEGMGCREIARRLRVTHPTVSRWIAVTDDAV